MDFSPKVEMADLLTAWRIMEAGLRFSAAEEGKNTDISAGINEETSTSSTVGDVK